MAEFKYTSVLSTYMYELMAEKHAHGHESSHLAQELRQIDRYLNAHPTGALISEDYYQQWFSSINDGNRSRKTIYKKASSFCQLLRYMRNVGIMCYLPRLPRENDHKFIPYIFTHDEVSLIFNTADALRIRNEMNRTSLLSIPPMMRVLYSTGMRVGEAIKLRNKDVDFRRHTILLHETKNNHQRLCPINNSLEPVLKEYISYRNRLPLPRITDGESPFFVTRQGRQLNRGTVERWFRVILNKAGIPYIGNFAGPRVHDLRHSSCVHAMIKLTNEGMDLRCSLPLLSKFLGHLDAFSTERYLRMTQEVYPDVLHKANLELPEIEEIIKQACKIEHWDEDN